MNYEALCAYADGYLATRKPDPVYVGRGELVPSMSTAVYVAVDLHDAVLYVGSVSRPTDPFGVRSRIDEHMRKRERFASWDRVWIVPLKESTPLDVVRRIEGRIGAHLGPSMSRSLPSLRKPGSPPVS